MTKLAAFLALPLLAAATANVTTAPAEPDTTVRAIIDKALERATWAEEQAFEARYRHAMVQRTRKFDKQGDIEEDESRLYRVEPVRGVPYSRLVSKNGGPIEGTDLRTERERWRNFLEELDKEPGADEDDENIVFNDELLERFTAKLEGIRDLRGRPSYVLSFEPRPGNLPVRRQIDRALNKSRGEIWVGDRRRAAQPEQGAARQALDSADELVGAGNFAALRSLLSAAPVSAFEDNALVLVQSKVLGLDDVKQIGTIKRFGAGADVIIMLGGLEKAVGDKNAANAKSYLGKAKGSLDEILSICKANKLVPR